MGGHIPVIPVQCSPTYPPLPSCTASAPPPWCIGYFWGGSRLRPPMAPSYHRKYTVGGVGCPTPELSRCLSHASAVSTHVSPFLSLPSYDTPQLGNPAALPHSGLKSNMSLILPRGWGIPLCPNSNNILVLSVCRNQTCRQVRSTFWSRNLQPLAGPLCESLPCHPSLIHLF